MERYGPNAVHDDSDLFANLIYPKQAGSRKVHIIDFGRANYFEIEPIVNTESLTELGDKYKRMTFRLDYFDQLKV